MSSDLAHVTFRDELWLRDHGISEETALDYFALSQFYDRSCDNEQLKMQRKERFHLKNMRGYQYEVSHHSMETGLFVITRVKRESAEQTIAVGSHYILRGTIYQSPEFFSVLSSRFRKTCHWLHLSFESLREQVIFDPKWKYYWHTEQRPGTTAPAGDSAWSSLAEVSRRQVRRFDGTMRQNRDPAKKFHEVLESIKVLYGTPINNNTHRSDQSQTTSKLGLQANNAAAPAVNPSQPDIPQSAVTAPRSSRITGKRAAPAREGTNSPQGSAAKRVRLEK